IAHNGNVINYQFLKKKLINEKRRHINTSSDVEIILNILADRLEEESPLDAVKTVMDEVNGSYSCISYIAGKGMLAFRDPHGIKPLILGHRGDNFCLASESVTLDVLGYEIDRDVSPGEAIFIDMDRRVTAKVIKEDTPRHCIFEYIYFARPDSVMDGLTVYDARMALGRALVTQVRKVGLKPDVVIPVPDTARTAALSLAQELGVPYREGLIKNRYIGRTFIMPRDAKRMEQVRHKLNPIKKEIEGKKVLLVDDSIVRGTTSKAIVNLVKRANPKELYFASSCPPLKYPCFYGIDMQTRDEFIARTKSIAEIQQEIGVDELIYQDLEEMLRALGNIPSYCTACFNGDYPTRITEGEIMEIEKERKKE
ncbi:amidophosphoribosyltransferase, partial [candidate division WOR-3 bacterium]|nr:amidophosphoribosyltransferase [candidate division WOR-3 bacterium]